MDETGHSGDTGATGGGGAESRDRTRLNGWASSRSPWSSGASPDDDAPDEDVPSWRRPAQEIRPFTRQPGPRQRPGERPSADVHPFPGAESQGAEIHPFPGAHPPQQQRSVPPAEPQPAPADPADPAPDQQPEAESPAPRWSDSNRRYDDLLKHFSGARGNEPSAPARFNNLSRPDTLQDDEDRRPAPGRPRDDEQRPHPATMLDAPTPSSAPPFPYEGDLDDDTYRPPGQGQQTTFPSVRPAPPPGRRNEPARHALDPTPAAGLPQIQPPSDSGPGSEGPRVRQPYDPVTFPRRLPYEPPPGPGIGPPAARPASGSGYAPSAPRPASGGGYGSSGAYPSQTPIAEEAAAALPQRVPAKPDVPTVADPALVEPSAETPELARIATHLRRDDLLDPEEREEGFDVDDILAAVREVAGVRDAMVRTTPAGANSLRLDLAEGADPAEVSRQVARLLQDRMGLDAAPQGDGPTGPLPPVPQPLSPPIASASVPTTPMPAAFVPSQPGPSDPIAGSAPAPAADLRRMPTMPQMADPGEQPTEPGAPGPLDIGHEPAPRVMIDNVQVTTFGTEASVEVRLVMGGRAAKGVATGPSVDGYLLRLCATATTEAINDLLVAHDRRPEGPARCFVEHAAAVPFGSTQVAVVVLLMSAGGWVEQLAGSAMVGSDGRHAMVRATLAAANRRLEALLSR
ncbi:Daple [Actinoplanes sp. NPDC049265]|uniref:Daple n=1 Tax=Actinoplanes sp. NPDC049265 TaxID=3363902 RepID=UPI003720BE91